MSKQTSKRTAPPARPPRPAWVRWLLMATILPMAAGAVLLLAALINVTLWRSPGDQAVLGGALLLGGFALANALQQLWRLAGAWALGAAALLLGAAGAGLGPWAGPAAWVIGAAAAVLLVIEFIHRMPNPNNPRPGGRQRR
jgi:hypothetical protein